MEGPRKKIKVDGGLEFFNAIANHVAAHVERRFWPAYLKIQRALRDGVVFDCYVCDSYKTKAVVCHVCKKVACYECTNYCIYCHFKTCNNCLGMLGQCNTCDEQTIFCSGHECANRVLKSKNARPCTGCKEMMLFCDACHMCGSCGTSSED